MLVHTKLARRAFLLAASAAAQSTPAAGIDSLSWLSGEWEGQSTSGTRWEERWTPARAGIMLGTGRTTRGDRLLSFEFLRIVERSGSLIYIAQPSGRPPTEFPLARTAAREAVFENPSHDFPKSLAYSRQGDELIALLTGDEKGQSRRLEIRFKRV